MEVTGPTEHYKGSRNASPKKGLSGAGTDWINPNGHAFVRRGSGIPMSKRASRQSQLSGAGAAMIANQSKVSNDEHAPSRDRSLQPQHRPASREESAHSRDCGPPVDRSRVPSRECGNHGGYSCGAPARVRAQSIGGL